MKYSIKRNTYSKNSLWEVDTELFNKMSKEAISEKEREFFEVQHYKQVNNFTCANDLLMSELSNSDHLYIVRVNFDEYIFGVDGNPSEVHTMNLSDALSTNLKEAGLLNRNITLHDWLRERDYQNVEYEHNFDDI